MAFESYANGWPDLKKLDELAQQVASMPTFTSSDKEVIEDLIDNAQALIEVAEDGAAGVVFDNTGTDLSSTNVEDAIKEVAADSGEVNYSETERKVGKWMNEDLYEKTVHVGVIAANTQASIAHNIPNISKVIRYWGFGLSSIGACIANRFESSANTLSLMTVSAVNTTWAVGSSYGSGGVVECDLYAIIQYTKTPAEQETRKRGK